MTSEEYSKLSIGDTVYEKYSGDTCIINEINGQHDLYKIAVHNMDYGTGSKFSKVKDFMALYEVSENKRRSKMTSEEIKNLENGTFLYGNDNNEYIFVGWDIKGAAVIQKLSSETLLKYDLFQHRCYFSLKRQKINLDHITPEKTHVYYDGNGVPAFKNQEYVYMGKHPGTPFGDIILAKVDSHKIETVPVTFFCEEFRIK